MPLHFAAARPPLAAMVSPACRGRIIGRAANDNAAQVQQPPRTGDLRAALRHFAEHGLGAATVARSNAEQAFFRGDRQSYRHWLSICRTLDQRMARVLSARVSVSND